MPFKSYEIKMGERVELFVEIDWNRAHINKSFSVTVWGEKAEVDIKHREGHESAHYYVAGPQSYDFWSEDLDGESN